VYVAEDGYGGSDRVQMFDGNGQFLAKWGGTGSGMGQFLYPQGVAMDGSGNIYVVDDGNDRIQVFGPPGPTPATSTTWGHLKTMFR
jgi:tripartite motif-containing protein 71